MRGKNITWNPTRCISQIIVVVLSLFLSGNFTCADAKTRSDIRLVLQITIDGLRADLINRYEKGFGKGGFRHLMAKGANYTNAHYQHANTETIVGHATLATGTFPSQHGMVGNVWFDREAGELAYNIEDPDSPIIPARDHETKGEQVDPAQKISRTQGRSPAVSIRTRSQRLPTKSGRSSASLKLSVFSTGLTSTSTTKKLRPPSSTG